MVKKKFDYSGLLKYMENTLSLYSLFTVNGNSSYILLIIRMYIGFAIPQDYPSSIWQFICYSRNLVK